MNKKLFNFGHRTILYLFNILFFLTFIFALTSPNLIVGDNKTTGAGTTMVTTVFLITVAAITFGIIVYPRIRHFFWRIFVQHRFVTASIFLGLVVVWQIVFVLCVHPPIGFDPGAIHFALTNTTDIETRVYYSLYYNNILLLLIQHQIALLFHSTSWLLMDFATMIVVDLSAAFNIGAVAILKKQKVPTAMYIHALWLAIFPMIIIPYTDAWVLPLVSCYLLCYIIMRYSHFKPRIKLLAAIVFGLSAAGTYFMKPSAIVPVIAIVLIEILYWIKVHPFRWPKLPRLSVDNINRGIDHLLTYKFMIPVMAVLCLGGGYVEGSRALNNQTYIIVNQLRAVPAIHFISMGVSGDGGYNPHDALVMAELQTKEERSDYSKDLLVKRLKQLGPIGYAEFLVKKQRNNTADGTFAWDKEGHFINDGVVHPSDAGFTGKIRQFVYLYGTHLGDFRFLAQFWWIIWLGIIAFGWRNQDKLIQLFRMAIIGGMLYLLLFEGGRSRYLIQFFPILLLMATMVVSDTIAFLTQIYHRASVRRKQ